MIEEDIRDASTLPGAFYTDPHTHARVVERVLGRGWHVVARKDELQAATPVTLLDGCLDEPLVLTTDKTGARHCLSNVCTHRGNLLVAKPCDVASLRCRYHGRRFALDGRFTHMPEFEEARSFPSLADDLPRVPFAEWGPVVFASLAPRAPFAQIMAPVMERVGFLFAEGAPPMVYDASRSKDYEVQANWALYCDNYLEGFHIPFVHAGLAEAIDYGSYATETFAHGSVQIAQAKEGQASFELPPGHRDHGKRIAAYYFWLMPCTMLNFYPWGLSLNVVQPLGLSKTRLSFWSFVQDASKLDAGAGSGLERVEHEDEEVVESVQRGVRSRLYTRGRFSPTREIGVHHFHRLLSAALEG
jgi:choline monooxygenase